MKKVLLFVFALLLFSSCAQRYECQLYSDGESVLTKPHIIRAENDEIAYRDFISFFDNWADTNEKSYINKTITFEVKNCKTGENVADTSVLKPEFFAKQEVYKKQREERERLLKEKQEKENQEAIIAWDDVKFGITKQQALRTQAFRNGKISKGTPSGSRPRIDEISMDFKKESYYADIMGFDYPHPSFTAFFGGKNSDELMKIEIKMSGLFKDNHFSSLRKAALIISRILEEKYDIKKFYSLSSSQELEIIEEINKDGFVYNIIGTAYCGSKDGENGRKTIQMTYETSSLVGYKQLLLILTIENNKYPTTKWEVPKEEQAKIEAEKLKKEQQKERQKSLF